MNLSSRECVRLKESGNLQLDAGRVRRGRERESGERLGSRGESERQEIRLLEPLLLTRRVGVLAPPLCSPTHTRSPF